MPSRLCREAYVRRRQRLHGERYVPVERHVHRQSQVPDQLWLLDPLQLREYVQHQWVVESDGDGI